MTDFVVDSILDSWLLISLIAISWPCCCCCCCLLLSSRLDFRFLVVDLAFGESVVLIVLSGLAFGTMVDVICLLLLFFSSILRRFVSVFGIDLVGD